MGNLTLKRGQHNLLTAAHKKHSWDLDPNWFDLHLLRCKLYTCLRWRLTTSTSATYGIFYWADPDQHHRVCCSRTETA